MIQPGKSHQKNSIFIDEASKISDEQFKEIDKILKGVPVICPREDCRHKWRYKGKARWITCPICRKLFKNPDWKPDPFTSSFCDTCAGIGKLPGQSVCPACKGTGRKPGVK